MGERTLYSDHGAEREIDFLMPEGAARGLRTSQFSVRSPIRTKFSINVATQKLKFHLNFPPLKN